MAISVQVIMPCMHAPAASQESAVCTFNSLCTLLFPRGVKLCCADVDADMVVIVNVLDLDAAENINNKQFASAQPLLVEAQTLRPVLALVNIYTLYGAERLNDDLAVLAHEIMHALVRTCCTPQICRFRCEPSCLRHVAVANSSQPSWRSLCM